MYIQYVLINEYLSDTTARVDVDTLNDGASRVLDCRAQQPNVANLL